MTKYILAICVVFVFTACTSKSEADRVLSSQGYTNIKYTGYGVFQCSKGDIYQTGFEAKSPIGRTVRGTVCSGFLKGATVRFR